jgi:GT2 family glycosyltransferase
VFAFGLVVSSEQQLERYALPGIRLAAGPDPVVLVRREQDCIFAAYNSLLEEALELDDLEGVVLLHQDLEIVDGEAIPKLRRAFADPSVGVVGVVGGVGVRAMGWWFSERSKGAYGWDWLLDPEREEIFDPASFWHAHLQRSGEVDAVDGMLMAISAPAARELRFDERLAPGFHGYDTDFCFEARRQGWRVRAEAIDVVHHNPADLPDREEFVRAHVAFAGKWGM